MFRKKTAGKPSCSLPFGFGKSPERDAPLGLTVLHANISEDTSALNCHGTEPFWGATLTEENVALEGPGFETPVSLPVTSVTGAAGYLADFLKVYSNQNGPVAIVTSNKCSDGMSDFTYPREVILFSGSATLYGCCGEGIEEEN